MPNDAPISSMEGTLAGGGLLPSQETLQRMFVRSAQHIEAVVAGATQESLQLLSLQNVLGDLSQKLPVGEQNGRGTCTAFATSACAEILQANETAKKQKFSPEFVYWAMRERFPLADPPKHYAEGGTKLSQAKAALEKFGICSLNAAPYQPFNNDLSTTHAPSTPALDEAKKFAFSAAQYWDLEADAAADPDPARLVYNELTLGRPCAAAFVMFRIADRKKDNWRGKDTLSSGIVYGPEEEPNIGLAREAVSGHVVCVTGYQPDPKASGGGWFIFKNSWGHYFGNPTLASTLLPNIPREGYGAVSHGHMQRQCWELLSLKRDNAA